MSFSHLLRKIFRRRLKKIWIITTLFVLAATILLIGRSCRTNHLTDNTFHIGQPVRWEELGLQANERNFAAFNNEILAVVAKQEEILVHVAVHLHPMLELEEHRLDGILTTLEPHYTNEHLYHFSEPYFLTGPVLIVPVNGQIQGWNEKGRKIIGISTLTPHLLHLEQDPSIQVKQYDNILEALSDLNERRIDAAIFPLIPAYTYTTTFYKSELKIATLPLTSEGVRLVTLKNDRGKELIDYFNEGLAEIKQKGIYSSLLKRWYLINAEEIVNPNE